MVARLVTPDTTRRFFLPTRISAGTGGVLMRTRRGRVHRHGDLRSVKDAHARERVMHVVLGTALPSVADLEVRLPRARVEPGDTDRELTITFDRFTLAAGEVLSAVSQVAELVDVSIDEPAIEDVVRKVYAGELHPGMPAEPNDVPAEA